MEPVDSIMVLRGAISFWHRQAEEKIERGVRSREEASDYRERFEAACAALKTETCPFCGGQMLDTSPLKQFGDDLRRMNYYLYQGERFTAECKQCRTYRTEEPRDSAKYWTPENTDRGKQVFANDVFRNFPEVDEVALERGAGRGWMFRIGEVWYANSSDKGQLKKRWGMR